MSAPLMLMSFSEQYGLGRSVEQLPDIASGLVRRKVDVLVASGTDPRQRPIGRSFRG